MNTPTHLFYPVFALVTLTVGVLVILGRTRIRAVRERRIDVRYFGTNQGSELPDDVAKPTRNFTNLFEAPVLFYVVCLLVIQLERVDTVFVVMAWVYVLLRYLHSGIHLTYNRVAHRFGVYIVSCVVMFAIWARLAVVALI